MGARAAWQVTGIAVLVLLGASRADAQTDGKVDEDLQRETVSEVSSDSEASGTGKTLQERIRAVSRRTFLKAGRFELQPNVGITTNDPFFRAWAFGGRAGWHLSEEFAIEVGGAYAPILQQLEIFQVSNVDPDQVANDIRNKLNTSSLIAYGDAGITFSPFYGKVALASELVGHFDVFLSTGVGVVVDTAPNPIHPAFELGVGTRFFLNRFLALRMDLRNYLYPTDATGELTIGNMLLLNAGVSIYFPLDFDYARETLGAKG
jgi:outer membrane beta-barrel protein